MEKEEVKKYLDIANKYFDDGDYIGVCDTLNDIHCDIGYRLPSGYFTSSNTAAIYDENSVCTNSYYCCSDGYIETLL